MKDTEKKDPMAPYLAAEERMKKKTQRPPSPREKIRHEAWSAMRFDASWSEVKTKKDWDRVCLEAESDFHEGRFLLEHLGADRSLEPKATAVLLYMRQRLIAEYDVGSAAEFMVLDMALIAYYNTLKTQRLFGDAFMQIEREMFASNGLQEKAARNIVIGYRIEDMMNRITDKLQILLDRANQMMLRNLKALPEVPRRKTTDGIDQVEIAAEQLRRRVSHNGKRPRAASRTTA